MFLIYNQVIETKIPEQIRLIIPKPNPKTDTQYVIVKGKLGQYTLKWNNALSNDYTNDTLPNTYSFKIFFTQSTFQSKTNHFLIEKGELDTSISDVAIMFSGNQPFSQQTLSSSKTSDTIWPEPFQDTVQQTQKINLGYNTCVNTTKEELIRKGQITTTNALMEKKVNAIQNQIKTIFTGVTQGYSINLGLSGIGFTGDIKTIQNKINKQKVQKDKVNYLIKKKLATKNLKKTNKKVLYLSIGLSHNVLYNIPENYVVINVANSGVGSQSNTSNALTIFGISKQFVNQIAATIYHFRKPEPYKGKGIRYDGEKLFMKEKKK